MLTVPTTPLEMETRLQDHALDQAILIYSLSLMPKNDVQPFLARALKGAPHGGRLKHDLHIASRKMRRQRERRAAQAEGVA